MNNAHTDQFHIINIPLILLAGVLNAAFYGACLLVPYYLVAAVLRRQFDGARQRRADPVRDVLQVLASTRETVAPHVRVALVGQLGVASVHLVAPRVGGGPRPDGLDWIAGAVWASVALLRPELLGGEGAEHAARPGTHDGNHLAGFKVAADLDGLDADDNDDLAITELGSDELSQMALNQQARITLRDRPYERNMERDYIHQLNLAYESFFSEHDQVSVVLSVDTDDLDYVRSTEALKFVENRIRQTLRLPPFQQELPLEAQTD
mgnify:CR=1 FL=1